MRKSRRTSRRGFTVFQFFSRYYICHSPDKNQNFNGIPPNPDRIQKKKNRIAKIEHRNTSFGRLSGVLRWVAVEYYGIESSTEYGKISQQDEYTFSKLFFCSLLVCLVLVLRWPDAIILIIVLIESGKQSRHCPLHNPCYRSQRESGAAHCAQYCTKNHVTWPFLSIFKDKNCAFEGDFVSWTPIIGSFWGVARRGKTHEVANSARSPRWFESGEC